MNERFMKNGVFSLEYDKETLRDMVLELQQENSQLKGSIRTYDILLKSNVEENKQLKQKYENAVADYETTMFEKEQLNSLVNSCQEEIRQLKKQLEDYKKLGFKHLQDKNNNLETQQKEFINYLEKRYKDITSVIGSYGSNTDMLYGKKDILEEIFQEFKSIIGDDK